MIRNDATPVHKSVDGVAGPAGSLALQNQGRKDSPAATALSPARGNGSATSDPQANNAEEFLKLANDALAKGDLDTAKANFLKVQEDPQFLYRAKLGLSLLAYRARDWLAVAQFASDGLSLRPRCRRLSLLLARAHTSLRDWPAATAAWQVVTESNATSVEARFQLARAHLRAGDRESAIASIDRLAALCPTDVAAVGRLLQLSLDIDDLARAREAAYSLVERDPSLARKELESCERHGDMRGVAVVLQALRSVDDFTPEKISNVSEQLMRSATEAERAGLLAKAYLDYRALSMLQPQDPLVQKCVARVFGHLRRNAEEYVKGDRIEEALDAYRTILRCDPGNASILRNYGRLLMRRRDWQNAIPTWRLLIERSPIHLENYVQLARSYGRSGNYRDALAAWRDVLARDADNEEAKKSLSSFPRQIMRDGKAAMKEGRLLDAWQLFSVLRAEEPSNGLADQLSYKLGLKMQKEMRTGHKERRPDAVMSYAEPVSEQFPDDAKILWLIARAAMKTRQFERAIPAWRKIVEVDPVSGSKPHLQLAHCYMNIGQLSEAKAAIQKVLAQEPHNTEALRLLKLQGA